MIFKSPLPKFHYYHNKRLQVKESQYLIPTYSWTITPILNWTCSIVTISHFQCMAPKTWLTIQCTEPNTWLTTNLRNFLVTKPNGVQTQQLLEEKDELGQIVSGHNMLVKNLCIKLHLLASAVTALKTILIYI